MKDSFKIIVAVFVLNFFQHSLADAQQNLVPNPSFEDTVFCPTGEDQISFANGWVNFSDQSPDYFNVCASNIDFDVPYNWGGYQIPSSGNAYCALSAFYPATPNKREIIGRSLSSNMVIGTKYYFSMKVSLSVDSYISSSYACNKLGVRFSTSPYSTSIPSPINNQAHIYSDSIITDTLNWTTIFGSFIADSSYSYLALGNFFDDSNTDTTKVENGIPSFVFAYYYIDDICVSTDSSYAANYIYAVVDELSLDDNLSIFPNPTTNYIQIKQTILEPYDLLIYNALGQQLYKENHIISINKIIDIAFFSQGLLFITIKSGSQSINYKLLKL